MAKKVPKKESAKRGYMTEEEVEEHLKDYKSADEKMRYLNRVSRKPLSAKTREAVVASLAKAEEEKGWGVSASYLYLKIGRPEKAAELLEEAGRKTNTGDLYQRAEYYGRAAKIYEELGKTEKAKEIREKEARAFEQGGWLGNAGAIWEKLDKPEKAVELYERLAKSCQDEYHRKQHAGVKFNELGSTDMITSEGALRNAERIRKKYGLKGGDPQDWGEHKNRNLTSRLSSIIAVAGILGGIFFLSASITGNAIANMTNASSSFLGAGLLIVSLVAGFFWLKARKK